VTEPRISVREGVERALRHWPAAYGLALQLTGERAAAEDLCQEAYLRLCRKKSPFREEGSLRAYVLTTVRNVAKDMAGGRPAALDFREMEADLAAVAMVSDPVRVSTRGEERRRVTRAVERLPSPWRAALYLRDGLDLSYGEIALILDTTDDVVRTTLHRARNRVREMLQRMEAGNEP
jgi:RNA polymerase sigma-70 factor (ECF subfamily)